jgi:hypothetical protein
MTGSRPQAFALCNRWMSNQEYQGAVRWLVVDDGESPQTITLNRANWTIEHIRPTPFWKPGQNTQARNILAGLSLVRPEDRLVIIEDDDYYAPGYLEAASAWLDHHDLAGEALARYYNVKSGLFLNCNNNGHASLCSTAMKGSAIIHFREVVERKLDFIDMTLWRTYQGMKQLYSSRLCVGIKGLPGRAGIGAGHRLSRTRNTVQSDSDGSLLSAWCGDDWTYYLPYMGEKCPSSAYQELSK